MPRHPAETDGQAGAVADPPRADTPAIRTRGLTKRFGSRTAVDGIDLEIPAGVIAGIVGPNGSGKTTTIRMLLSMSRPSAGTAEVLGSPINRPAEYLPRVGAMIEGPSFYWWLSGRRNLEVLAALAGTSKHRVDEVLALVELEDRADDVVRRYSLGMKQRLGIAAALLPEPSLLILAEPANGLDPAGIRDMRRLLLRLRTEGVTIFISSHVLSEIEQIADWVLVLKEGRILFQGTIAALAERRRSQLYVVPEDPDQLKALAEVLIGHGHSVTLNPPQLTIDGVVRASDVIREAVGAGIDLSAVAPAQSTLEDTFLEMTSDQRA